MQFTQSEADFILIPNREAAIADWQATKAEFNRLQQLERVKRAVLYKALFPNNVDTTETLELSNGYQFKATGSLNYKLKFSKKENGGAELDNVLDQIEKSSNEGAFIAERLVTWSPELSVGEYKKLDPHGKIKSLIDSVLTISPGSPTLEVVAPKNK